MKMMEIVLDIWKSNENHPENPEIIQKSRKFGNSNDGCYGCSSQKWYLYVLIPSHICLHDDNDDDDDAYADGHCSEGWRGSDDK
jgi:hypothetical protein